MNFNKHYDLNGKHAFLSASNSHWLGYSDEKLDTTYTRRQAVQRGTDLHELAAELIRLGVKMPRSKRSFDMYVNDAIGYRMDQEVLLYFSDNAFGTADTICFRKNFLRIHDLKTGITVVNMNQLDIYASFFCLEYDLDPFEIGIELRKYQNDEVVVRVPSPEDIKFVMDKIVWFDHRIEKLKTEV